MLPLEATAGNHPLIPVRPALASGRKGEYVCKCEVCVTSPDHEVQMLHRACACDMMQVQKRYNAPQNY